MKVKTGKNNVLDLRDKSFASGGQGGIFDVIRSPYPFQVVVKIYHKPEAGKDAQKKIEYMVKNNPFKLSSTAVQQTFAWPLEAIYDYRSGKFIGYMMVKIENVLVVVMTPIALEQSESLELVDHKDAVPEIAAGGERTPNPLRFGDQTQAIAVMDLLPVVIRFPLSVLTEPEHAGERGHPNGPGDLAKEQHRLDIRQGARTGLQHKSVGAGHTDAVEQRVDRQGGLARGGLPQPKIREDRKFLNPPLLAAVEG